ncbi:MAG: site-2 protease family protein [Methanobrevibacter sp.]|jgi:membrane-associated protease RseP (regulator of RpoE activity)|nr:site-2 protease family protein [Candidatus Methanovirga basalitermitum]
MNGIWYYIIAFIVIWIVALIFKKPLTKAGVEITPPMLMWKTTRLRTTIDKIANKSPRFWKGYMNVGIVVSFIAMVVMSYLLIDSLLTIKTAPSVSLVIPGVEIPGSPITVPLGYGLIALATVLIVHEFSHGILARVEKISIKSIGLMLLTILPGAFVEPDDEEIGKISKLGRMRIYAAGSVANMSLALVSLGIIFLISNLVFPSVFYADGMDVKAVIPNAPADHILKTGMTLKSVDGKIITDTKSYNNAFSELKPNQNILIITDKGEYYLTTSENPQNTSKGYVGVSTSPHYEVKKEVSNIFGGSIPWIIFNFYDLFNWIFILNLGIGLFNLLPIRILDGGALFKDLLTFKFSERIVNPLLNATTLVFVAIIVFSIVYGLFKSVV